MASGTIDAEFVEEWVQEVHCATKQVAVAAEANPEKACGRVPTAWSKQKKKMLPSGCEEGSRESKDVNWSWVVEG